MHYSLYLLLPCTIFLLILIMLFYKKENTGTLKNKIYKILLLSSIIIVLSEFIEVELYYIIGNNIYSEILLYIHWFIFMIWEMLQLLYFICYLGNNKTLTLKELFNNNKVKIIYIVLSILLIISLFISKNQIDINNIKYLRGNYTVYCLLFIALCNLIGIIFVLFKKDRTKENISLVTVISLVLTFTTLFQRIYESYSILTISIIVILFILYITSENPTLDLVTDTKNVKKQIDESSKVKTDVILNMSHDIRSPMNAIVNYSESIANMKEIDKDEITNCVNNILVSGKNLLNIIGDVLDISSNKNDIESNEEIYSLKSVINDLTNITKSRIGNKPIKLELNISKDVPDLLKGNSTKVYRIIMNVLSNAAKYTDVGKIIMTINCTKKNDDIVLHIKVSDSGFGIKDEDKPKIFSEFGRLKDATKQNIEGTGLGLINTKKNIENLGGKIWFESSYGAGSIFYMDIPQKIADDKTIDSNNLDAMNDENLIDCKNKKVLVVDDNKLNCKIISRLLERYNYKVDMCTDGEDCIDKIKIGKKYDIIFMDVLLKGLNGIEVMKILKKLGKLYNIPPIVALTANTVAGARETYMKDGFDEYISKPIDINELDRIINKFK